MHILTLTPFYPSAEDEASGCFVAESAGALERQGVESTVIAVQPRHRATPRTALKPFPASWTSYLCIPGNAGLSSAGRFLHAALKSQVRQLHRQKPIGLIHAHAALPCGHAAMLLAKNLGIPFVVTVHGLDAFSTRQVPGWLGRACFKSSQDVYKAAARVICISEQVAGCVREGTGTQARINVVYNGVDATLFSPPNETASNPVILSVGNLIPIKGLDLLLKALAAIKTDHPHVRCRIIGEGPERIHLKELARALLIDDRVEFLGRRPRSEVAAAMKQCALFALPSWYEGLGCVYLEAMAAGRPAVACRGQGIDEIIRHKENGWLVEPQECDGLTAGLRQLLSDMVLRENIGRNARETILRNHTLTHQATQLLAIYRESLQ